MLTKLICCAQIKNHYPLEANTKPSFELCAGCWLRKLVTHNPPHNQNLYQTPRSSMPRARLNPSIQRPKTVSYPVIFCYLCTVYAPYPLPRSSPMGDPYGVDVSSQNSFSDHNCDQCHTHHWKNRLCSTTSQRENVCEGLSYTQNTYL